MKYDWYRFSIKESILYIAEYLLVIGMTAFLFYDSVYAFLFLLAGLAVFLRRKKKQLIQKRKKELCMQFQEAIASAATAMSAGYSVENAFREAWYDMQKLYGEDSLIARELKDFMHQLSVNRTLEEFLLEFADRADVEDIMDFGIVFSTAKKNGGNFNRIIQRSVDIMRSKRETEQEIEVLLSGKQYEQKIMGVIPFVIIGYMRWSTGSFMDVLYHNPAGIVTMSMCLLLYAAAILLSEKIVAIEV